MSEKRSNARQREKECFVWRVDNLVKKVRRELVALPVTNLNLRRSARATARSGRAYILTADIWRDFKLKLSECPLTFARSRIIGHLSQTESHRIELIAE